MLERAFKYDTSWSFTKSQIEQYVAKARPTDTDNALTKIRDTYNLMELSQRPMLLAMIVKSIDKLAAQSVNPATLYEVFTDAWIYRDQWRDILSAETKLAVLTGLAWLMWTSDTVVHYGELAEYAKQASRGDATRVDGVSNLDHARTASFLVRDERGNYAFAHKSYGEFFVARHVASQLKADDVTGFSGRRLTAELMSFIIYGAALRCPRFSR